MIHAGTKRTVYSVRCTIQSWLPRCRVDPARFMQQMYPEGKFKELEPRLKYGWFHLQLNSMFQDLKGQTGYVR